jgi:hypothetical protein
VHRICVSHTTGRKGDKSHLIILRFSLRFEHNRHRVIAFHNSTLQPRTPVFAAAKGVQSRPIRCTWRMPLFAGGSLGSRGNMTPVI